MPTNIPPNNEENIQLKDREAILARLLTLQTKLKLSSKEYISLQNMVKVADLEGLQALNRVILNLEQQKKILQDTSKDVSGLTDEIIEFSNEIDKSEHQLSAWLETMRQAGDLSEESYKELSENLKDISKINDNLLEDFLAKVVSNEDLNESLKDTADLSEKILFAATKANKKYGLSTESLKGMAEEANSVVSNLNQPSLVGLLIDKLSTSISNLTSNTISLKGDIDNITENITESQFDLNSLTNANNLSLEKATERLQSALESQIAIVDLSKEQLIQLKERIQAERESSNITEEMAKQAEAYVEKIDSMVNAYDKLITKENKRLELAKKYGPMWKGTIKTVSQLNYELIYGIERWLSSIPGGYSLSRILGVQNLEQAINQQLNESFIKFTKSVQLNGGNAFKALGSSIGGLAKGIYGLLGPFGILIGILAGTSAALTNINDKVKEISQRFGVSRGNAWKLYEQVSNIQTSLSNQLSTYKDILDVSVAMSEVTGTLVLRSDKVMSKLSDVSVYMGYGADEAAKFQSIMEKMGMDPEIAVNMQLITGKMAEAEGLSSKMIADDLINNSTRLAELFAGYPKKMVKTVIEIRKMGLSIDKVVSIADSLLDIESSLTAEFEASAALGRQINLQQARQYAIEGNMQGVAEEVLKNVGSRVELEQMSYMQRRLLAKSLGMEVEEMLKAVSIQEKLATLPKEQRKEAARLSETIENIGDLSAEQYKQEIDRRMGLEKMNAQWDKIKTQLLNAVLPLAESLAELLMDISPILTTIAGLLRGIGTVIKWLQPLINGIMLPFRFIGATIETINEHFSDTVETGTAMSSLMDDVKTKFSGTKEIVMGIFGGVIGLGLALGGVSKTVNIIFKLIKAPFKLIGGMISGLMKIPQLISKIKPPKNPGGGISIAEEAVTTVAESKIPGKSMLTKMKDLAKSSSKLFSKTFYSGLFKSIKDSKLALSFKKFNFKDAVKSIKDFNPFKKKAFKVGESIVWDVNPQKTEGVIQKLFNKIKGIKLPIKPEKVKVGDSIDWDINPKDIKKSTKSLKKMFKNFKIKDLLVNVKSVFSKQGLTNFIKTVKGKTGIISKMFQFIPKLNPKNLFKLNSIGSKLSKTFSSKMKFLPKMNLASLKNIGKNFKLTPKINLEPLKNIGKNIKLSPKINLPNLKGIGKKLSTIVNFKGVFNTNTIKKSIQTFSSKFGNMLEIFPKINLSKLKNVPNIFSNIATKANKIFKISPEILTGGFSKILKVGKSVGYKVMKNFAFKPKFDISEFGLKSKSIIGEIPSLNKLLKFIPTFNLKGLNLFKGNLLSLGSKFLGSFSQIPSKIIGLFSKTPMNLVSLFSKSKGALTSIFTSIPVAFSSSFGSVIASLFGKIKGLGTGLFGYLSKNVSGISNSITKLLPNLSGAIGKVASKGSELAGKLLPNAGKLLGKGAETAVEKGGAKLAGKGVAKLTGKGLAKAIGKKIPGISAILGTGFAINRLMEGDYVGAGLEMTSGLASTFLPGIGTVASLGIDAALMARDIAKENEGMSEIEKAASNIEPKTEIKAETPEIEEITEPTIVDKTLDFNNYYGEVPAIEKTLVEPKEIEPFSIENDELNRNQSNIIETNNSYSNVKLDTKNLEFLVNSMLQQMNQMVAQLSNRPIDVNIGDKEVRKINNIIKTQNGQ